MQKEDLNDPVINFIEPETDNIINMPDTIDVRVEVTDDKIIKSIVLSLVNADKVPVIPAKYYYPESKEFTIHTSLPITDKNLASGAYSLLVSASDGMNSKNKYRQIILNEIPVRIDSYIAVTGQFNFKSNIYKLNPALETDTQFVIPEGFFLSGVHSQWGKFFFISKQPSRLKAINPEGFDVDWEFLAEPSRPLITGIFPDRELVFSTANGDAGILSGTGIITLRTAPYQNKSIQCLAADEKYIYAGHVSLGGDIHELTVYYRVSGFIRDQKLLTAEIISLLPENNRILVFMTSPEGAKILEYDPQNLTLTEIDYLPGEDIKSTVKISENLVFMLTDKRVISYDLIYKQITNFISQSYNFCRYDPLFDFIYLVRDNNVYGYDRLSGAQLTELVFAEKVLDFQILYNK